MRPENLYWVWLSCRLGAASKDFLRLLLKYENPYDIYMASDEDLSECAGVSQRTISSLSDKRLEEPSGIIGFCAAAGIAILPYNNEKYPNRLRLLPDPPVLLYVKGSIPDMNNLVCIAVVGTRRMSEYGRECAYRIAYELGAAGAVVVSGMALGIDGVAACGALVGGGITLAVLGCGIDVIYPREHAKLMGIIAENGAIVSEYPPGTPPIGANFPLRNRIISGMCQGTLIVEADARSGAMITARSAEVQGRQVFAIPGNLGEENTEGTNQLIHDGAIVVIKSEDILDEYNYLYGKNINTARLFAARRKYEYSDEPLARMGVSARYSRETGEKSNRPSAPAEAFRTKSGGFAKVAASNKLTDDYVGGKAEKPAAPKKPSSAKKTENARSGDDSAELLASLDEKYRRLFAEIPVDRAVPLDTLAKLGYSIGEIMSAMTVLEVKGLVSSLPGGLYVRR